MVLIRIPRSRFSTPTLSLSPKRDGDFARFPALRWENPLTADWSFSGFFLVPRSKASNKRFRGKISVRSGRVILAIFGIAIVSPSGRAVLINRYGRLIDTWKGEFKACS
jgi:hypothetical protein